ncbi:hypothetical protein BKD30_07710 [Tersicoccus phoenicis]|uniref:Uncharacterized protein n=1 Tax=Tersicoccus phoenicis TaxID=554083 RepID=A0A1R1LB35_9MICC|nr:hypothetical protein [Tersicoccus phoenicis]OMH24745.1 hypothetical protein BKD30_07710 [Tersicoccus phoenicis]
MNPLEVARAAYGITELAAPAGVEFVLTRVRADGRTRAVARILGGRHVLQALLLANASSGAHRLGAFVDATHALSMVGLALVDRSRRRTALASAAVALGFAVAEFRQ